MSDENKILNSGHEPRLLRVTSRLLEQADFLTQSLYSMILLAAGWTMMAEQGRLDVKQAADGFKQLDDTAQQALKELRLLVHQLQPPVLEEVGLVGAIQQRLDTVERRASVETRLIRRGDVENLPYAVEEQLFQIAQEALNNALRHAKATAITVSVHAEADCLFLSVEDNGTGFDPTASSTGTGLVTMQKRAEAMGGTMTITSAPKQGTTVEVTVALQTDEGYN
jgi:signal transduction histidine kinase